MAGKSDSRWQFIGPLDRGTGLGPVPGLEVVVVVPPPTCDVGALNPSEFGSLGSRNPGGGYGGGVGSQKYPEQMVPPQSVLFPLQVGPAGCPAPAGTKDITVPPPPPPACLRLLRAIRVSTAFKTESV